MHVSYRGDSSEVQALLDDVTQNLPAKVQRFVMERVCFIAVGSAHGHGQTWNRRYLRPSRARGDGTVAEWIITLSEDGISPRVVAHEIAHAFLGHDATSDENEREANALADRWGFPT